MDKRRIVAFAIKAVGNDIKRFMDNITQDSEVTGMQRGILLFIGGSTGDVFQKDVEKRFNIRRSSASGMLQLMEKNGLIKREGVAHDARLKKLSLTEKAHTLRSEMIKELEQIERIMIEGIAQEELDVFFGVLQKISQNLTPGPGACPHDCMKTE